MSKTSRLDHLVSRLRQRENGALARAITLAETSPSLASELHERVHDTAGRAVLIGITGAPGVGKSTLVNRLVSTYRDRKQRVAVIAVDPSSPITGGAVLGDRTRMGEHGEDQGVFIRSVAARGHLGGLSAGMLCILDLVDSAGWDVILLETVGTGQSETEVAEVADIKLVIEAPGLGDDVQAIKAGVLEIADIIVINKADQPLAARTERQLRSMLQLRDGNQQVPVVSTIATEADGIHMLTDAIDKRLKAGRASSPGSRRDQQARRLLAGQMMQQFGALILSDSKADIELANDLIERLRQHVAQ